MVDKRTEYDALINSINHWGTIELICERTKLSYEVVRQVVESLRLPHIAEASCQASDVDKFLDDIGSRVYNLRAGFWLEACACITDVKPPADKGTNYKRIFNEGLRAAQDKLEDRFA